jgi:hypothetical protein
VAKSINGLGDIAGYCGSQSFLRSSAGSFTTFGDPDATGGTFAFGINDSDQIAGYFLNNGNPVGFLRNPDGSFINFDLPGSQYGAASGINDSGQVAGNCYIDATFCYYLATQGSPSAPEPSTFVLLGAAPVVIRLIRNRRGNGLRVAGKDAT